ncbi:hypothetical protein D8674_016228 [Pyrus ussuriensis x Pyrus communis]|uniref:Uncharacterized protein n=1 Tax=Pyrus ussuriensis x Pyrus communis TaxID=2448454 RepID=A0A5N5HAF9_9ROSA|nr:hypothetical protein D8674_016228 [Pyrus ussuriensis x Pyrus communis]
MAIADQTPTKQQREETQTPVDDSVRQATSKRQRDETLTLDEDSVDLKRQKPYTDILSLLDEEEVEPSEDLSSLITTLQQEISSEPLNTFPSSETVAAESALEGYASSSGSSTPTSSNACFLKEDECERVMRHLLEASDDELGIPQREADGSDEVEGDGFKFDGLDGFSFGDGLWELEDEAANYYTLVQSELFM